MGWFTPDPHIYLIKCITHLREPSPHSGWYLLDVHSEANEGYGKITWTQNYKLAMTFVSPRAAKKQYNEIPLNRNYLIDGRVNKPMTEYQIEIVTYHSVAREKGDA